MTVKLEGTVRAYVGESTDVKPTSDPASGTIPAGSTFEEVDTGRTAKYDGYRWRYVDSNVPLLDKLDELLMELKEIKELHTAVVANL